MVLPKIKQTVVKKTFASTRTCASRAALSSFTFLANTATLPRPGRSGVQAGDESMCCMGLALQGCAGGTELPGHGSGTSKPH